MIPGNFSRNSIRCIQRWNYSIFSLLRSALFYSCFFMLFLLLVYLLFLLILGKIKIYYQRFFTNTRERELCRSERLSNGDDDDVALDLFSCTIIIVIMIVIIQCLYISTCVDLCNKINDVLMKGIQHKKPSMFISTRCERRRKSPFKHKQRFLFGSHLHLHLSRVVCWTN